RTVDAPAGATSVPVKGLANGTTYQFVVTAVNAVGKSGASNKASATPSGPPRASTGLVAATGASPGRLSWTGPSCDGGPPMNSSRVCAGTSPGGARLVAATAAATSVTVKRLANGTRYHFVVTAVNAVGKSRPSDQASATPSGGGPISGLDLSLI